MKSKIENQNKNILLGCVFASWFHIVVAAAVVVLAQFVYQFRFLNYGLYAFGLAAQFGRHLIKVCLAQVSLGKVGFTGLGLGDEG